MGITKRTEKEMNDQIAKAIDAKDEMGTLYHGMSYEDGIIAALDWVLGNEETAPMEDE